jgi:hypothetical protein
MFTHARPSSATSTLGGSRRCRGLLPLALIGSVAFAASAMGSASHEPPLGALRGVTGQGLPISLTAVQFLPAKHYYGRAIHFEARLTCTENGIPSRMTAGPFILDVKPNHQSEFTTSSTFEAGDFPASASVSGRVGNHQASGRLRVTITLFASSGPADGIPCDSGRVTWKAG